MQKDICTAILDETQELMRSKTIEDITIREICTASQVSRQSFYNCFLDKYEVIEAIYQRDYGKFHATLDRNDSIWTVFPKIMDNFYADRKFYANAFRTHGQNSFREYCRRLLHPFLFQEFRDTFDTDDQFEFFFENFCEMTFSGFLVWLEKEPCPEPEEYAVQLEKVLLAHLRLQSALLEQALNKAREQKDRT